MFEVVVELFRGWLTSKVVVLVSRVAMWKLVLLVVGWLGNRIFPRKPKAGAVKNPGEKDEEVPETSKLAAPGGRSEGEVS